jgi:hypothetical protein
VGDRVPSLIFAGGAVFDSTSRQIAPITTDEFDSMSDTMLLMSLTIRFTLHMDACTETAHASLASLLLAKNRL